MLPITLIFLIISSILTQWCFYILVNITHSAIFSIKYTLHYITMIILKYPVINCMIHSKCYIVVYIHWFLCYFALVFISTFFFFFWYIFLITILTKPRLNFLSDKDDCISVFFITYMLFFPWSFLTFKLLCFMLLALD